MVIEASALRGLLSHSLHFIRTENAIIGDVSCDNGLQHRTRCRTSTLNKIVLQDGWNSYCKHLGPVFRL